MGPLKLSMMAFRFRHALQFRARGWLWSSVPLGCPEHALVDGGLPSDRETPPLWLEVIAVLFQQALILKKHFLKNFCSSSVETVTGAQSTFPFLQPHFSQRLKHIR
jgi:hypothetical protein